MNGYERIVTAIKLKQPDRVPTLEWLIDPKIVEALCPGGSLFDMVEKLDLDGVGIGGGHFPTHATSNEPFYIDRWGVKWQRTVEAYAPIQGAIKSMADLKALKVPSPYEQSLVADTKTAAARFKGKRFIAYRSRAEFMSACDLRGFEDFLTDMVDNPDLAFGVLEVISDYYCKLSQQAIKAGADAVVLADDWAFTGGPFMSPKQFRTYILPYFKKAVDVIHAAGGYVVKHVDGNIWPILDDLMTVDIDMLNPLQPDAGMDLGEVKKKYGNRVCLSGNINCGHTLTFAPVEEVIKETKEALRKGAPGGGYVLMSSNSLHSTVNPANYKAMVETCQKLGKYPLNMKALSA